MDPDDKPLTDQLPEPRGAPWLVSLAVLHVSVGAAVPLSYLVSARQWSEHLGALWGQLPQAWRLPYTVCMFPAAAGYLVFSAYLFRCCLRAQAVAVPEQADRLLVRHVFYGQLLVLLPSAAWMPLTLYALAEQRPWHLWIQLVLAMVALGTVFLGYLTWYRASPSPWRRWARVGVILFAWQTVCLDAIVWPRFFILP